MLMISAIIQPSQLEQVRNELIKMGVLGMTVSECIGHGRNGKMEHCRRAGSHAPCLICKWKVEVAIAATDRDLAIAAIVRGAKLGKIGDGKIFVSRLDEVIRIRTGERGIIASADCATPLRAAE
jgi:nitrogen regulatory protein P-II 1